MTLKVTRKQADFLERATTTYQANVAQAADYLLGRGITGAAAQAARLGVVSEPLPGHENYAGRLAIPYIAANGTITDIRFRCAQDHDCKELGHAKYLSQPGHSPRLYNTVIWDTAENLIGIAEGELDALILTHRVGIPAVGISGVQAWKAYYKKVFEDFEEVLVFGDGDDAGRDWRNLVCNDLENASPVHLPDGHDVTSLFMADGAEGVLGVAGVV